MSNISVMRNIRTPLAWKERLNEKVNQNKPIKLSIYRKLPVALIAVIALAVLLAGTALAYALTGGAFFTKLFEQKAKPDPTDYSYIDVSQLPEIAGTTSGTVVDTDELRIDVIDVISSGNDAMIALRVTAKQLDSVLRYTGWDEVPLNNYQFGSEDGTLFSNTKSFSFKYIYSDEDHSLADNQFYLVLNVISLDGFKSGTLSFNLRTFGYYNRLSATGGGEITAVYQGPWTIELKLSGDTSHSRTVFLNQNVDIGKYKYNIKDVFLSPFSVTAIIAYDGAPDLSSDRIKAVMDAASDLALYLKNGIPLEHGDFSATTGGDRWPDSTYRISLNFAVPVNVEEIEVLHVFGHDYNISPEFNVTSAENSVEATTPVPTSPSYTTQWTDEKKHDLYTKMLNSIDHYDYASGTLKVKTGGTESEIDYRVNLLTGEAYEKVTDKDGNPTKLEYSDGKTLYSINPQSHSYTTDKCRHRGDPLPEENRITNDPNGNLVYSYRDDGTNTVFASEYSLLPQGLAMKYLSDENKWYFCGTGNMCGRYCVAIRGTAQETTVDGKPQSITFEIMVDAETGVILQYLCWDAENNITDVYIMKSLSYENPGSFSEVDKSIKELITQYK